MKMSPLEKLKVALPSASSRHSYQQKLKHIFKLMEIPGSSLDEQAENFVKLGKQNEALWVKEWLIAYIATEKERIDRGEIKTSTLKPKFQAIRLFCEINEEQLGIEALKWKTLTRMLPPSKKYSDDKAYTPPQIRKLIDNYSDRRLKPLVLVMCSSGIRLGAWEYLKWKHVEPVHNEKGELLAAVLTVYDDEEGIDKHYSFITPEAYNALNAYIEFRKSHREEIAGESWLMRDSWETNDIVRSGARGLATHPEKLHLMGIRKMLERALKVQGVRTKLPKGKRRYEVKEFHGFRKFFETQATKAGMNQKNIDKLLNHHIGYDSHYYKPLQDDVLKDYLKAVPKLTISDFEKSVLLQKVEVLEAEKEGKLERASEQIERMQKQIEFLMEQGYESERRRTLSDQIIDLNREHGKPLTIPKVYDDKVTHRVIETDEEFNQLHNEINEFEKDHERYKQDIKAYAEQKGYGLWEWEQHKMKGKSAENSNDNDSNNQPIP